MNKEQSIITNTHPPRRVNRYQWQTEVWGRRVLIMLTGLVVVLSTVTWAWEYGVDLRDAPGVCTHMSRLVTRIACAETAPPAESTTREVTETTPSADLAAPAGPASEESRPLTEAAVPDSHLDLETLEQRLRQTDAIGFFTKLSLRNQIDDLL